MYRLTYAGALSSRLFVLRPSVPSRGSLNRSRRAIYRPPSNRVVSLNNSSALESLQRYRSVGSVMENCSECLATLTLVIGVHFRRSHCDHRPFQASQAGNVKDSTPSFLKILSLHIDPVATKAVAKGNTKTIINKNKPMIRSRRQA